ncbi:UDP-glucuronosyl/UDP-glucosyltransferase [Parasponia andersonii]|uniref:Glycosyltransferase n=1 Tax=Parasponia andersonii TaxID=3476 RepID=A0A2P5C541_PARAD|nr:UDP-glucuronosyl/UDP-glucosyltransferase [Parasponia andersonii]
MATQPQKNPIHFVMLPLGAQGHLIPMIDIARVLARRINVIVTIVTTPRNTARFNSIIQRDIQSGLPIRVSQLQFPHAETGLPEGSESLDTLPSPTFLKNYMHALSLLQQPLEKILQELNPNPSCMVSDKHIIWAAETAQKFRIPRVLFDGMSCFARLFDHMLCTSKAHESVSDLSKPFLVPGLPDRVELNRAQLPGSFNPGLDQVLNDMRNKVKEAEQGAFGVLINSFEELEGEYVKIHTEKSGEKIWCIGPVSLCNKDDLDKAQRGNDNYNASNDRDKDSLFTWLDSWGQNSVVYACLGSLNRLTPPQLAELGLALEASKRPFVWVIRGANKGEEFEEWLKEDGFEERTRGQGFLIRVWAPQVLILSHPAIGAFLTHCGWNSTLEGVCAGVPMVTWPLFAEQFYNEKFIVQVKEIGVRVGAEVVVHLGEEERFGGLVKRDQIREAIDKVMDEGKEGEERRGRARKLAKSAKEAVDEGGSSYTNITLLLDDIMHNMC